MEIIKYFLFKARMWIYLGASLLFSLFLSLVSGHRPLWAFLLPVFFQLFLIRSADDLFDYENDRQAGRHTWSKSMILAINLLLALAFMGINFGLYGFRGLYGIFILGLIYLAMVMSPLKNMVLSVSAIYYLGQISFINRHNLKPIIGLIGLSVLSVIYTYAKDYKRKQKS